MHTQDHKIMTASSTGHEVHLCRRCGWPYAHSHPSSKQRRHHKRVCGTIEGYKVIHSEGLDHQLSVSDGEHASDGDEHTPSPDLVKKKADFVSGGGVGGMSNKSEYDVYSDAVTEFPDSGISPRLEEHFDNVRGLDKSIEQNVLEGDPNGNELVKVNETAASQTYTNAEAVSDWLVNSSDGHGPEDKMDSVTVDSEVVKNDPPPRIENLQNVDASAGVESVSHSTQINSSTETARNIAPVEETKNFDASVEVEEVSHSSEVIGSIGAPDEHSVDEDEKTSLAGLDTVSADDTSAPEDDQITIALKKDVDHCEDTSNSELVETGNEKGEGDSVEVKVTLDSIISPDNSPDVPSSCEVNGDARNLEELSKTEFSSLESRDNGSKLNHDIGDVSDEISPPLLTSEDPPSPVPSELQNSIRETNLAEAVIELKDNDETVASERTPEQPIATEVAKASESIDAAEVSAQQITDGNIVPSEDSDSLTPKEQEAPQKDNCSNGTSVDAEERHSSEDVRISKSLGNVSSVELTSDGNVVTSDKTSATGDRKDVTDVENVTGVNSKSLQDEVDDKLTKHEDDVSAIDLSGSSSGGSGSLEGNCGSVSALSFQSNTAVAETNAQSPDTLETNSQNHKTTTNEGHPDKSDIYEPPSFMTLVQSDDSKGNQDTAAAEIETVQNNEKPKTDALQAGWFPSLTNVSNESEGRKKNEEIIAKVTNWSPGRQHGPLKSLLSDVKSPKSDEVPDANQTNETSCKENGAEATLAKDHDTNKDLEEWNSPARYPIEITKEKKKKKGKSYWVPFVCCSSVHRDL